MYSDSDIMGHLTDTIKALAAMSQTLQSLQDQVRDHSNLLIESKSNDMVFKEQLRSMSKLLSGDGGIDSSLATKLIRLESEVLSIKNTLENARVGNSEKKSKKVTYIVLTITVISGFLTAMFSGLLPFAIKLIQDILAK